MHLLAAPVAFNHFIYFLYYLFYENKNDQFYNRMWFKVDVIILPKSEEEKIYKVRKAPVPC